ncbi:hypothetical protein V6V89_24405 [Micromonospora sp. CPCC 206061]
MRLEGLVGETVRCVLPGDGTTALAAVSRLGGRREQRGQASREGRGRRVGEAHGSASGWLACSSRSVITMGSTTAASGAMPCRARNSAPVMAAGGRFAGVAMTRIRSAKAAIRQRRSAPAVGATMTCAASKTRALASSTASYLSRSRPVGPLRKCRPYRAVPARTIGVGT